MNHLKPGAFYQRHLNAILFFSLLILWISVSSCGQANPPEQEETVQLPDTLQTAQQLAEFGAAQMYMAWNFDLAGAALKKAVDTDPDNSLGQIQYGWYLNLSGDDETAATHMAKATEVDPQNPLWQAWQAWHCLWMKKYACTDEHVNAALAVDFNFHWAHYVRGLKLIELGNPKEAIPHMEKAYPGPQQKTGLSFAHARAGNREKALEILETLESAGNPADLIGISQTYVALGDYDAAFQWLEKAYEQRHIFFPWSAIDPTLEPLKKDERFKELMARVDLP